MRRWITTSAVALITTFSPLSTTTATEQQFHSQYSYNNVERTNPMDEINKYGYLQGKPTHTQQNIDWTKYLEKLVLESLELDDDFDPVYRPLGTYKVQATIGKVNYGSILPVDEDEFDFSMDLDDDF